MFPTLKQRLGILAAIALGGWVFVRASSAAAQPDGGCSLLFAESPLAAIVAMIAAGALTLGLAAAAGATGNVLAGPFVLGGAVLCAAVRGGGARQWLIHAQTPRADYLWLAAEAVLWFILIALALAAMFRLRPRVRAATPAWAVSPSFSDMADQLHLPADAPDRHRAMTLLAGPIVPIVAEVLEAQQEARDKQRHSHSAQQAWAAAFTAAIVGGILAWILLRNTETKQVAWGLGVAFMVGSLTGHLLFPGGRVLPIILSPLLTAAAGYVLAAMRYTNPDDLLHAVHTAQAVPLALALPVYYASAGVMGAAMGVGWAQAFIAPHVHPELEQVLADGRND